MIAVLDSLVTGMDYAEGRGRLKKKKCWGNMLLCLKDSSCCCAAAKSVAVCPAGCRAGGARGAVGMLSET